MNTASLAARYTLQRHNIVLMPDPHRSYEAGGVLNPAAAIQDTTRYLLYRAVARDPQNYSRIMVAELRSEYGDVIAHRLDVCALEPTEPYEKWRDGIHGGVEDPRVTPLEDGSYLMTYTAYGDGPGGDAIPRIALARSSDLFHWERLGLIRYTPLTINGRKDSYTLDLQTVSNKDAVLFPTRFGGHYLLLHRPTLPEAIARDAGMVPSIWISSSTDLITWTDHHMLMTSEQTWENLKTGAGTPPVWTPAGWLAVYHGVQGQSDADPDRCYRAGVILMDQSQPRHIVYRSAQPVLEPGTNLERTGVVNNVVFPTGTLPTPDRRAEVYYGMADAAIGMAVTQGPVF